MRKESALASVMNFSVSGYVYFVAFTLVLFMISSLVAGLFSLGTELINLASSTKGILAAAERGPIQIEILHTIAFTIVLVKAYKILMAYAETRHINIKFLVEISIIGPSIELIFNSGKYDLWTNVLFAGYALINLVVYLYFYKTLHQASEDYRKEFVFCEPEKPLKKPTKPKATAKAKAKKK